MAKTMIASLTDGQIEAAVNQLRDAMRKHRDDVNKDAAQQALGTDNLGMRMFTVFREVAEVMSGLILRRVMVNLKRSAQEAIKATGRVQYTDSKVLDAMPTAETDLAEVHFFKLGRYVSDADLEKEYELRGLKPCDPYSLAAVNEAEPEFADEHPNGTHWQDANGEWCFAAFSHWRDGRSVRVDRDGSGWSVSWCFAGVRK